MWSDQCPVKGINSGESLLMDKISLAPFLLDRISNIHRQCEKKRGFCRNLIFKGAGHLFVSLALFEPILFQNIDMLQMAQKYLY